MLLPALYAALVAADDEPVAEMGERAEAWALGLREDSPLIPVVDVLLLAPGHGLDCQAAVRHLFDLPAFAKPVAGEDRRWCGRRVTSNARWRGARRHLANQYGLWCAMRWKRRRRDGDVCGQGYEDLRPNGWPGSAPPLDE